jgi:hypothetical protein
LRFTSNKGEQIDVMYNNIAHAFYQVRLDDLTCVHESVMKDALTCGSRSRARRR